jgi:hypothetical protein
VTTEQPHQAGGPEGGSLAGPASLTRAQVNALLPPLNPARVRFDDNGAAHLPQWDVRRSLIEIFGFGGFSTKTLETTLVAARSWVDDEGVRQHSVTYRMLLKLTVKNRHGHKVGSWDGSAVGYCESPVEGRAHHVALTSAESLALKRAAMNLGNQFGLSLYDGGSVEPVVRYTLAEEPDGDALLEEIATAPSEAAMRLIAGKLVGLARVGAVTGGLYEDLREAGTVRIEEIRQAKAVRAENASSLGDGLDDDVDGLEATTSPEPSDAPAPDPAGESPDTVPDTAVASEQSIEAAVEPAEVVDVVAIDGDTLGAPAASGRVRRVRTQADDPWQTPVVDTPEVPGATGPGTEGDTAAARASPSTVESPEPNPAQSALLADGLKARLRDARTQSDLGRVATEVKLVKGQLTTADREAVREAYDSRVTEVQSLTTTSKAS